MARRRRWVIFWLPGRILSWGVALISLVLGLWILREPAIWTHVPFSGWIAARTVVIDPGHGGVDAGTKSRGGLKEKDINLDVGLQLKNSLGLAGLRCVMTREIDRDFMVSEPGYATKKKRDLAYRARIANESRADVFLSIHANSFPNSDYYGAQTFYQAGDSESRHLAQTIQSELVKGLGPNHRLARPGDYRVLRESKMPAVTVEVGFLSNEAEANRLGDPEYRKKIAAAICRGVVAYFQAAKP